MPGAASEVLERLMTAIGDGRWSGVADRCAEDGSIVEARDYHPRVAAMSGKARRLAAALD
jgi:hypothetical protein